MTPGDPKQSFEALGAKRDVLLAYGSPLLLGMGIMAAFVLLRKRRGLDGNA